MTVARRAWRLLLLGLLAAGALASGYVALRAAWADMLVLKARWNINRWQAGKVAKIASADWMEARSNYLRALSYTPADPQLHDGLGYLYGLRAMAAPETAARQGDLVRSIEHYQRAAAARPMSPYSWANIALALHYRDHGGDALWQAFDRAVLYGRREAGVQKTLAEIAFARWDDLADSRRQAIFEMAQLAGARTRKQLLTIAERYGRQELLAR